MLHHQGHVQLIAKLLAVACKQVGGALQTVVHMHRPHLPGPLLDAGQQQRTRIRTAAQGHSERQRGMEMV